MLWLGLKIITVKIFTFQTVNLDEISNQEEQETLNINYVQKIETISIL